MSWALNIDRFSRMLDEHLVQASWAGQEVDRSPMEEAFIRRIRCSKVHEEAGEVEEALIALEGSNPRKMDERSNDMELRSDLIKELAQTAIAALAAIEHLTGNRGLSPELLDDHMRMVCERAGIGWEEVTETEIEEVFGAETLLELPQIGVGDRKLLYNRDQWHFGWLVAESDDETVVEVGYGNRTGFDVWRNEYVHEVTPAKLREIIVALDAEDVDMRGGVQRILCREC